MMGYWFRYVLADGQFKDDFICRLLIMYMACLKHKIIDISECELIFSSLDEVFGQHEFIFERWSQFYECVNPISLHLELKTVKISKEWCYKAASMKTIIFRHW